MTKILAALAIALGLYATIMPVEAGQTCTTECKTNRHGTGTICSTYCY